MKNLERFSSKVATEDVAIMPLFVAREMQVPCLSRVRASK